MDPKYAIDKPKENFDRVSRALQLCAEIFRDILSWKVQPSELESRIKRSRNYSSAFRDKEKKIIKEATKDCTFTNLDISLLYKILRNVGTINAPHVGWGRESLPQPGDVQLGDDIERIRFIRNEIHGHNPNMEIEDAEFNCMWNILQDVCIRMESLLNKPYTENLKILYDCPMDVKTDEMKNRLEKMQKNTLLTRIEKTMDFINHESDSMENIFIETKASIISQDTLHRQRFVMITGQPGAGKTTIAQQLMKKLMLQGKQPIQLHCVEDWDHFIRKNQNLAIFIDDIFGRISVSKELVNQWTTRFGQMAAVIEDEGSDDGNFIIMTTRSDIYAECQLAHEQHLFLQNGAVNISVGDCALSGEEMRSIFIRYVPENIYELINKISSNFLDTVPTLGFPQCCRIFRDCPKLHEKAENFFLEPLEFLKEEFSNRIQEKDMKMAVLVYILLNGGKVDVDTMESIRMDKQKKVDAMEFCGVTCTSLIEFRNSVMNILNCFILKDDVEGCYTFSHSSIQSSLFLVVGNYDIQQTIESCHPSLLKYLSSSRCPKVKTDTLTITNKTFDIVIQKIFDLLKTKSPRTFTSIAELLLWYDDTFFRSFIESKRIQEFLEALDNQGKSMMIHFAAMGNGKMVRYIFFKLKNNNMQHYFSLNIACESNHSDIVEFLLGSRSVQPDILTGFHAVKGGNIYIFQKLVERGLDLCQLHKSLNYRRSILSVSVIVEACIQGQNHLILPLLQISPELIYIKCSENTNVLHWVAFAGDTELLQELIHKKRIDPHEKSDIGSTILHFACQNGKTNTVEFILKHYPELLEEDPDNPPALPLLFTVAQSGNVSLFKLLVKKGMPVTSKTNIGETLLHGTGMRGQTSMCRYIVQNHAELLLEKDFTGASALHYATIGNNIELINFLVENGLDVDSKNDSRSTVLHRACKNGKLEMCKYLMSKYPHLADIRDNHFGTVLHYAAYGGNNELLEYLVNCNLNVRARDTYGRTVLHMGCLNGKAEMCEYLLDICPEHLDVKDYSGLTNLHYAAFSGNVKLLETCIEKGLDICERADDGRTVLHIACEGGNLEMSKYLMSRDSELTQMKDDQGATALHYAANNGHIQLFEFLAEQGLSVSERRSDGRNVLHLACTTMYGNQMCRHIFQTQPELLHTIDYDNLTLLHCAALGGNISVFQFLQKKGLDVDSRTKDGKTILHLCCTNGRAEMCKYLAQHYPEFLGIKDFTDTSVMHEAAFGGNIELFEWLVSQTFDMRTLDDNGKSVLHYSCRNGRTEMSTYLIDLSPDLMSVLDENGVSVLHEASYGGNIELFEILVERNIDCNQKDGNGRTVLHWGCRGGKLQLCKYLLESYPELLYMKDNNKTTVLHDAVWSGSIKLAEFLIAKGLNVKAVTSEGKTLFHMGCMNGKLEICRYILRLYPNVLNIRDNNDETALHAAARSGNIDLYKFLVNLGMDISVTDGGKTVLHIACMNGRLDLCRYLSESNPEMIHSKDNHGGSVLHDAAWGGCLPLIQFLVGKGLDVQMRRLDGKSIVDMAQMNKRQQLYEYLKKQYPKL